MPGAPKPDAILVADGVMRTFGGLVAVNVDHFEAQRHAITALIGPNGAGKSTFFNLLTGFDAARQGTGTFNGRPLHGMSSAQVARSGMVRTFQLTKALEPHDRDREHAPWRARAGRRELRAGAACTPVAQPREGDHRASGRTPRRGSSSIEKRDDYAGSLSGGQRKLLEMARALMSKPIMIMLDEPMAGVNPALTESLLDHIVALRDQGVTVLFVEHDMHMVRRISDWVVVMAEGRIIAEGDPHEVMRNQAVQDAYLGSHHDTDLFEERS